MTELKVGDRVKVEFAGVLKELDKDGTWLVEPEMHDYRESVYLAPERLYKISTPLPTKEGTVIESQGHRFMLTRGGWHASSDLEAAWTNAELQDSMYADDFTVVLEG